MKALTDITAAKKKLRKAALETRAAMDEDDWLDKAVRIESCFLDLFLDSGLQTIHLYQAMIRRNEIPTENIAIILLRAGRRVAVPVMSFESRSLTHVLVTEQTLWKPNRWGVSEPVNGKPVPQEELDLIIVPMVAADPDCNRLGYGKGYYDTFLKGTRALTVGFCFECCLYDEIPCEPHDVRLNHVITEDRFLTSR